LTDLTSLFPDVSLVPRPILVVMFLACVVAWTMLILFATANRNASALALLSGPAAVILALYAFDQPASAVQLAGFPYPAALCAAFLLAQQAKPNRRRMTSLRDVLITATLVALVFLHVPRAIGSVLRYTRHADRSQMFTVSDFDRLQAAIGDREVYIDFPGVYARARTIFPIVAEFGRRNIKSVWSPDSWHIAGSFRGASAPPVEKIPDLRLTDATEPERPGERLLVETPRYKLVRRSAPAGQRRE
jgi:hypothetical protein